MLELNFASYPYLPFSNFSNSLLKLLPLISQMTSFHLPCPQPEMWKPPSKGPLPLYLQPKQPSSKVISVSYLPDYSAPYSFLIVAALDKAAISVCLDQSNRTQISPFLLHLSAKVGMPGIYIYIAFKVLPFFHQLSPAYLT